MDKDRETGTALNPKFDDRGLITAIVTDADDGTVLMLGHMNAEALELSRQTGIVHFYSRSRQALWKKGETSGNFLHLREMLIDCDQDALWVKAKADGPTCHTGVRSCFYRRVTPEGLEPV
ncbi:phosphoribosyl-AMP cyclohydrolase [Sphingorhabdus arenilitoris]|uniref:phosphoribosyl-AMP cyclohydrolase n=1 Tax=Sphingorhabdus arenilitoris TaxID=1490041 RepID=A0ABV8RF95_9SPHN